MTKLDLDTLRDIEEIRRLKHRYCELCDDDYQAEPLAALFAEDGIWDAGAEYGQHKGREAIAAFFRSMPQHVRFSGHMVLNDQIDVDGDKARGKWRSIIPCTFVIEGRQEPHWIFGAYEDEFVKIGGKWYFTLLRSIIRRTGSHRAGWEG